MELIFIRHGQSANNALTDPTQRVQDPPLTPTGQTQAARVADYIAAGKHLIGSGAPAAERPPLDRLYCSAMFRALQTAAPIGKALGLNPEVWIDIHEVGGIYLDRPDGGADGFPGQNRVDIERMFPGYVVPKSVSDDGWWTGGCETPEEGYARAAATAKILWQRAATDERVGLVTHGDYLSHLLKALLGIEAGTALYLHHRNTALTRLHLHADGTALLYYTNHFGHLSEDLVT